MNKHTANANLAHSENPNKANRLAVTVISLTTASLWVLLAVSLSTSLQVPGIS